MLYLPKWDLSLPINILYKYLLIIVYVVRRRWLPHLTTWAYFSQYSPMQNSLTSAREGGMVIEPSHIIILMLAGGGAVPGVSHFTVYTRIRISMCSGFSEHMELRSLSIRPNARPGTPIFAGEGSGPHPGDFSLRPGGFGFHQPNKTFQTIQSIDSDEPFNV